MFVSGEKDRSPDYFQSFEDFAQVLEFKTGISLKKLMENYTYKNLIYRKITMSLYYIEKKYYPSVHKDINISLTMPFSSASFSSIFLAGLSLSESESSPDPAFFLVGLSLSLSS